MTDDQIIHELREHLVKKIKAEGPDEGMKMLDKVADVLLVFSVGISTMGEFDKFLKEKGLETQI